MYQQDWDMLNVEIVGKYIARRILHKDKISYEVSDELKPSQADLLYKKLKDLIMERRICEAENLLFENLNTNNIEYLAIALDCYQSINQLTEAELEENDFSRQEINDGLNEIIHKFHIPTIDI